jgi:hypothetical protein
VSELELSGSIVLITSSNPGEDNFGTGFLIHRDERGTYILTCAHVVMDVGGPDKVKARHNPASLVALGSENDIDLAVVRVEGLQDKPLLHLNPNGKTGDKFTSIGFRENDMQHVHVSLEGILGKKVGIDAKEHNEYLDAWSVEITDNDQLQPGNSGSPVVDQCSGKVIAVISHRGGKGETGFAISIKALKEIWHEMPSSLLQEAKPETISTLKNEAESTHGEVQLQSSTAELLTQKERETLIALLCELPNINYANVRHSLVSMLPAQFQSNIDFDIPLEDHITEIVDTVVSDPHLQLADGSNPIMVLIQNALNMVKSSQLRNELQLLLKTLKERLGITPQTNTVTTSLERFILDLDDFILQMPAIEYELGLISDSFIDSIASPDCEIVSDHLSAICTQILKLDTIVKQSHDLEVISHRIWLMDTLADFDQQAKVVQRSMENFCMTNEVILEEDQSVEELEKIQQQLDILSLCFTRVLETASKLSSKLLGSK